MLVTIAEQVAAISINSRIWRKIQEKYVRKSHL